MEVVMKGFKSLVALSGFAMMVLFSSSVSAQTTTTSTAAPKRVEVISVTGNQLVVRGPDGTKEYTVPESFRFNVDGKELSVHDLKPGMVAMSTVTTITTVTPVVVTEFRSAKVMQAFGNAVIVRSQDGGFKQITEAEAKKRNAKITKDGKVIEFQQLRAGDVISATIVTESAPKVMTEQQVTASIVANGGGEATKTAAAPAPAAKPAAAPAPAPAAAPAAAPAPKTLPKTASQLPLVGLLGIGLLAIGALMTFARRRRAV
jgi:LPXTG-motif cell wall-anchored protein